VLYESRQKRVLVAEDQALIGMMIEDDLVDAGYAVLGPFTTCAGAYESIQQETPDVAILDFVLADGPCTDLAIELQKRGVPFLLISGAMAEVLPEWLREVPRLQKPASLEQLTTALKALGA
jgi:DNA-binding response OmpR family regulator